MIRLSICIATFKRADFIEATLDSITSQLRPGVEVVVVDGASPDDTPARMAPVVARHPEVRYFREETNSGIDADFDKAVGYARGEHVWLMTDDDLMVGGGVARVLGILAEDPDLLIVDAAVCSVNMEQRLQAGRLGFSSGRRDYRANETGRLLGDTGDALSFIGCVVMRRTLWLARDRERFFGTLFIHVGTVFQAPIDHAVAIAEPLIDIRLGNQMWSARSFEIWMFKWPALVWDFSVEDAAKRRVTAREPWRSVKLLFSFRANGAYSLAEYRRFFANCRVGWWRMMLLFIAIFPGRIANVVTVVYLKLFGRGPGRQIGLYNLLYCSRFANAVSRRVVPEMRR